MPGRAAAHLGQIGGGRHTGDPGRAVPGGAAVRTMPRKLQGIVPAVRERSECRAVRLRTSGRSEVDVTPAIREELFLAAPRYVLCRENCKGLCPQCGKDLNAGPCGCAPRADRRWTSHRRSGKSCSWRRRGTYYAAKTARDCARSAGKI